MSFELWNWPDHWTIAQLNKASFKLDFYHRIQALAPEDLKDSKEW
jgi:hypothetical protein